LPAAFYYKTFMWPRSAWHRWYEPVIRRAAGLGRATSAPDPDRYAQRFAHCDVLVVGAGAAGLAAALAGVSVRCTGHALRRAARTWWLAARRHAATIDGQPAQRWLSAAIATLATRPNVTLLNRTTAFGYFPHNLVGSLRAPHGPSGGAPAAHRANASGRSGPARSCLRPARSSGRSYSRATTARASCSRPPARRICTATVSASARASSS
jgi:hypothetical protein